MTDQPMTLPEAIEEAGGIPHDPGDPRWNRAIDMLRDHARAVTHPAEAVSGCRWCGDPIETVHAEGDEHYSHAAAPGQGRELAAWLDELRAVTSTIDYVAHTLSNNDHDVCAAYLDNPVRALRRLRDRLRDHGGDQ